MSARQDSVKPQVPSRMHISGTLKAERKDVFVGSEDGAYPNGVRTRNSGACYSTVMGYNTNGEAKIVCK